MTDFLSPERVKQLAAECAATRARLGPHPPASAARQVAEVLWIENVLAQHRGEGRNLGSSFFAWLEVFDKVWVRTTWIAIPPSR